MWCGSQADHTHHAVSGGHGGSGSGPESCPYPYFPAIPVDVAPRRGQALPFQQQVVWLLAVPGAGSASAFFLSCAWWVELVGGLVRQQSS